MVHDHVLQKTCNLGVSTCFDQPLSFQHWKKSVYSKVSCLKCSLFAKDLSNALQKCFGYFAKASLSVLDPGRGNFSKTSLPEKSVGNWSPKKLGSVFFSFLSTSVVQRMPDLNCQIWNDDLEYFVQGELNQQGLQVVQGSCVSSFFESQPNMF